MIDDAIIALDPGTTQTGFVLYRRGEVVASGVEPNDVILRRLGAIDPQKPRTLAIEMIASYGMAVGREVFETCVWIGRFQQAWPEPSAVRLVYRRVVKLHLCESVKAKDTNIWQALVDRFGEPGTKAAPGRLYGVRSHARAALALAVTVADQMAIERLATVERQGDLLADDRARARAFAQAAAVLGSVEVPADGRTFWDPVKGELIGGAA